MLIVSYSQSDLDAAASMFQVLSATAPPRNSGPTAQVYTVYYRVRWTIPTNELEAIPAWIVNRTPTRSVKVLDNRNIAIVSFAE